MGTATVFVTTACSIELQVDPEIIPISVRRLLKEFSNKHGKKLTLNDFLRKFGTTGLIERTAVSGRAFLCHF